MEIFDNANFVFNYVMQIDGPVFLNGAIYASVAKNKYTLVNERLIHALADIAET